MMQPFGFLLRRGVWLALLSLVLVEPALAQPGEARAASDGSTSAQADQARQLFREASAAAEGGQWQDALDLYRAAYALYPHATTLYNIGYCHGQLGEPARALYYTARALEPDAFEVDRRLAPERQAEARALEQLLLERVGRVSVSVDGALPFTLRVDGAGLVPSGMPEHSFVPQPEVTPVTDPVFAASVALVLDPGSHELALASDGRTETRSIEAVAGQAFVIHWSPAPAPAAPPVAPTPSTHAVPATARPARTASLDASPGPDESSVYRPLAISSFAVGGAGLGLALVSGIVVLQTKHQLDDECDGGDCPEAQSEAVNRYETAAQLTNVGLWTGVVGGALGVGFLLLDSGNDAPEVSVVVAPSRVELNGTF